MNDSSKTFQRSGRDLAEINPGMRKEEEEPSDGHACHVTWLAAECKKKTKQQKKGQTLQTCTETSSTVSE